jgi:hypothetical protein
MQAQANTGLGGDVNILEAMEMFKSVPDQVLPKYAQDPKLAIFAAAEMARRDDMRKRYNQRAQKPNKPVVAQLAESMAPSMPMMPPGMNAPQEPQPMQMAPSQMSQPQMQPEMQLKMQPPMQQQMQAGLGAVAPQGMAGGGMVAFAPGGSVLSQEELEEVRRRAKESGYVSQKDAEQIERERIQRELDVPFRPANPMASQAAKQQFMREEAALGPFVGPLVPKPGAQGTAQPPQRQAVIPTQQAPAAPPPMGIEQIIAMGKKGLAGVPQIQPETPEQTAQRSAAIFDERQKRLPDQTSPIMEQLKKFYGQQPSQEDIQKAANRQIALAMMGSKDRNFLSGLAGGLQAGEDVKKSMSAENRAMQQASLQAQLAHAKYQDALRRGDYDAAERAAREERTYKLQTQKLAQEQAMMPLEVGMGLARAMAPKGGGAEAGLKPKDAAEIQMKVMAVAKPELDALETEYKTRASNWFFDRGPKNYQEDPEYQRRRQAIIQRVMSEQAPQLMGVAQVTPAGMRQLVGR